MRFNMTFAAALVFFVPGAILLTGMCLMFPEIGTYIVQFVKNHQTAGILLITVLCFVSGVLIESLKLITIDILVHCLIAKHLKKKGLSEASSDAISKLTAYNLPVYTLLVDRTYEYYRLNANLTLVFCVFFSCYIPRLKFDMNFCLLVLVIAAAMTSTCVAYYYTQDATSKFAKAADTKSSENQGDK